MPSANGAPPANVTLNTLPSKDYVGSWLCAKGKYQEYLEALSGSNPSLRKPDPGNKRNPLINGNALVVLLESGPGSAANFERKDYYNPADLQKHFEGTDDSHDRRRIYIMEGLAPDFISVIGGHFFMNPAFFQRQERSVVWSNDFVPTSDALPQPALLNPKEAFHLQYCELRQFNKAIDNAYFFCKRTGRHVGMTPARHKDQSTTGILRRKMAWWSRKTTGGGWDVVILCDPQLNELAGGDGTHAQVKLTNAPFQDGYVDFVPPPDRHRAPNIDTHPHHSMLHDLCHYYKNHSYRFSEKEWADPCTSAIFPKKIIAAHYLQLADYIKAMLPSLELRLTTAWVEEQNQWKSLQTISRRCGNYRDDIEDTLLSLDFPLREPQTGVDVDWKDCRKDFQYIYFRMKILKERADNLMQAMTGLASIAGNRQNLEEAKRVKRLNLLALLFIPLAYTSSLFSMQDRYAPGNAKFWVYWVSAVGLVVFTLVTTWILDRALDDAAQWTLPFNFWGAKQAKEKLERKKTGLFSTR